MHVRFPMHAPTAIKAFAEMDTDIEVDLDAHSFFENGRLFHSV